MSDEKKIRVSVTGDASALNAEIDRATTEMRGSFEDIGLEDILDQADKKFDKINDKIKAINDAFKEQHEKAGKYFDERGEHTTNDFGKNKNEKDREQYFKKEQEAWDKWSKLADLMQKRTVGKDGEPSKGLDDGSGGSGNLGKGNSKQRAGILARMISRVEGGNVQGAIGEGIQGEGGLMASSGMGAGGAMVVGGALVAVVGLISEAIKLGYEGVKLENKIDAKKKLDYSGGFGDGGVTMGVSVNEFKEFTIQQMANMRTYDMSQNKFENEIYTRLGLNKAYGLQSNEVASFDKFKQQDVNAANGSEIIADILIRSEQSGILGVNGEDFSLLPQKIETVANLLSSQKQDNIRIDSNFALGMMQSGHDIGGRFDDDRASDVFGKISSGIKSPGSPGMKAFIFSMIQKANPRNSYVENLAQQEGGLTAENIKAIMPQIDKIPQGDFKRMVIKSLFSGLRWQDAIQLDATGVNGKSGIQNLLIGANGQPTDIVDRFHKQQDIQGRAQNLTTQPEVWGAEIKSTLTAIGHSIVTAIVGKKIQVVVNQTPAQKTNAVIKSP